MFTFIFTYSWRKSHFLRCQCLSRWSAVSLAPTLIKWPLCQRHWPRLASARLHRFHCRFSGLASEEQSPLTLLTCGPSTGSHCPHSQWLWDTGNVRCTCTSFSRSGHYALPVTSTCLHVHDAQNEIHFPDIATRRHLQGTLLRIRDNKKVTYLRVLESAIKHI